MNLHGYGNALLSGTWITIQVMMVSLLIGMLLGLTGAFLKLSGSRLLAGVTDFFTTIVRGVPELILILFAYYGFGYLLSSILAAAGFQVAIRINPFAASVGALGAVFGAYATDIFRVSILAIPKGQLEAAKSVGMAGPKIFFRIMLPQVWRYALPGLGNLFLVLQKDTALVSVIGLHELMRSAAAAVAPYAKAFFVLPDRRIHLPADYQRDHRLAPDDGAMGESGRGKELSMDIHVIIAYPPGYRPGTSRHAGADRGDHSCRFCPGRPAGADAQRPKRLAAAARPRLYLFLPGNPSAGAVVHRLLRPGPVPGRARQHSLVHAPGALLVLGYRLYAEYHLLCG